MTEPAARTSVTVFGGGIAALTAAHELAERGLRVLVVEPVSKPKGVELFDEPTVLGGTEPTSDVGQLGGAWLPGCPRHLLDSMKRIPFGATSGALGTVADRLTPAEPRAMRAGLPEPFVLLPGAAGSTSEVYRQLREVLDGSFGALDVQMLVVRALRYLASCSERRSKECQAASLLDYLCGQGASSGLPAFRFGNTAAARFSNEAVLVAGVDAAQCDARAALNAFVQLHVGVLPEGSIRSPRLDGSLEDAWLRPWREHLKTLGVRFQQGSLLGLHLTPSTHVIRAQVEWFGSAPAADLFPSDYQLVALDAVAAERATRSLRAEAGVPADLQGFTTVLSGDPRQTERSRHVGRDPTSLAELGRKPWDRLRLQPWIEFFLPARVPELGGVVFLPDSAWGLECVSGPAPASWDHGANGSSPECVLRVTLKRFSLADEATEPEPAYTSRSLAREVWNQLERGLTGSEAATPPLPSPLGFRIDDRLELELGRVASCWGAKVVPVAGDWARRPEGEPTTPGVSGVARPSLPLELWSQGGYLVHFGSLVFAGEYARTFTRLGDAESDNESARHAVNAILAHRDAGLVAPEVGSPKYCAVWNPEDCEPTQFAASKSLDQQLFAQGLPHLWDLLGVELLPRLASQRTGQEDSVMSLLSVFDGFTATATKASSNSGSALDVLKAIRQYLERRVAQGADPAHAPTGH